VAQPPVFLGAPVDSNKRWWLSATNGTASVLPAPKAQKINLPETFVPGRF
jgi:hypothetical protein